MDDAKQPPGKSRPAKLVELERVLDEGLDDLDAGRTVSREQLVREVEQLLSPEQTKRKRAP
jgi:hypothetical protein